MNEQTDLLNHTTTEAPSRRKSVRKSKHETAPEPKREIAVVSPEPISMLAVIERAARDPSVDVEKMDKLLAMQERIYARNAEAAFNLAMMEAQTEMRPVAADSNNPQTRSKYASYLALDRAMRPIYTKHGFALSFDTAPDSPADWVRMICYVSHRDGFTRKYQADMPSDGKGAKGGDVMTKTHAVGSGMSYGMRYLLKLIFNISVGPDDDGNASSGIAVDAPQVEMLRDKIAAVGADESKFCKTFGIETLDQLPAKEYDNAVARLLRWANQQNAAK